MARPKSVSDEELRQTARRCFLEHGPGLSINNIAEELGITDAAILKRVGSKQELLRLSLSIPSKLPWLELIRGGPGAGPIIPQLVAILEYMTETVSEHIPTLIAVRLSGFNPLDLVPKENGKAPPLVAREELAEWLVRASETRGIVIDCPESAASLLLASAESHSFRKWVSEQAVEEIDWRKLVTALLTETEKTS